MHTLVISVVVIFFGVFLGADAGVEQAIRRKTLNDQQKYAAYVTLHMLCMSRGGTFKRNDKKDVANQKKGRCGRKPKDINLQEIPTIPLNKRSTIRSLAWQLGCSPTTLHRKFKLKMIKRHSNSVNPTLKGKNKKDRMEFCLSMVDETTIETARSQFTTNEQHCAYRR